MEEFRIQKIQILLAVISTLELDVDHVLREAVKHELAEELGLLTPTLQQKYIKK